MTARLSLSEVGAVAEVTATTVSRWENGHRAPNGAAGLRYAKLLALLDNDLKPGKRVAS